MTAHKSNMHTDNPAISPIEEIIEEFRQGRMAIIVDDEDRENEGDLVIPANFADNEAIAFMARHGCGLICLAITQDRATRFGLEPMAAHNTDPHHTAFTVSVDAKHETTTGISASDRARTIGVMLSLEATRDDLVSPGHLFPLVAQDMGVIDRPGHTEASVDLARLAGLQEAAIICEIMKKDGEMARLPDLIEFAEKHNMKIGTIADLIKYRVNSEIEPALLEKIKPSRMRDKKEVAS